MDTKKRFVASYSGGKDSMLAIYRAIKLGMEPVLLITTYNTDRKTSWFHGIPEPVLESVSASLEIPIKLIKTSGEEYGTNFVKALIEAREMGANTCVFGDIDIPGHLEWCTERCQEAGIEASFPLWNEERKSLVYELIDLGFIANLIAIDTTRMDKKYIGKVLTRELADEIEQSGVDICGENGEYHTFVSSGPIFRRDVAFRFDEPVMRDKFITVPITANQ